jgi:DNA-binding LytR/AlgR family response regulator
MFFHKQTKKVEQVEKFVRSLSITIPAKYEDEIYKLYPTDIYYIETIDRRTYLYTASRVYESSENLLSLEKLLEAAGLISFSSMFLCACALILYIYTSFL